MGFGENENPMRTQTFRSESDLLITRGFEILKLLEKARQRVHGSYPLRYRLTGFWRGEQYVYVFSGTHIVHFDDVIACL